MFVSITRSAGAAVLVASAMLLGTLDARAQMQADDKLSAEDAFQSASDECVNASKGQRSFCMINAFNKYKLHSAAEASQEGTLIIDAMDSNDSAGEVNAKEKYHAEANRCATLMRGQRSFCMINAYNDYQAASK
jgi:hypothetical protein